MPQRRWKELPHQNRNVNTKLPSKKTWFVPGDGGCKFRARSCIGMYMWQWACRSLVCWHSFCLYARHIIQVCKRSNVGGKSNSMFYKVCGEIITVLS